MTPIRLDSTKLRILKLDCQYDVVKQEWIFGRLPRLHTLELTIQVGDGIHLVCVPNLYLLLLFLRSVQLLFELRKRNRIACRYFVLCDRNCFGSQLTLICEPPSQSPISTA